MNIVFMGTPDFAVPSLEALIAAGHKILCVISQPDRAKDRKGNLLATPVKQAALKHGLKVYQYEKLKRDGVEMLKTLGPDAMVTVAYGQILTAEILDIPQYGVLNVHASLLPKYRGSAPIQWSVINGEKETGVTIMKTAVGIDDGDILNVEKTPIETHETSGELFGRLKEIGAKLLLETLEKLERNTIKPRKQNESEATRCRMLKKEDGHLNFNNPSDKILNLIRGVTPWPGAYLFVDGDCWKIFDAEKTEGAFEPSKLYVIEQAIVIGCLDGGIKINELQLADKRRMTAKEFLSGHKLQSGTDVR